MRKSLIVSFLLLIYALTFGTGVVELPFLNEASDIKVDDTQIYIVDFPTIYILSQKDFKVIKKFGRKGEGPGEFKIGLFLVVEPDRLVVSSIDRIYFFKKNGDYINETKTKEYGRAFVPIGNKYVGYSVKTKNKKSYRLVNIYDSNLKRIKEGIFGREFFWQVDKSLNLFSTYFNYWVCDDKIYCCGESDFIINVFDSNGKKQFSITQEYERIKFTEKHKDIAHAYLKSNRKMRGRFNYWKNILVFPDYLPAIHIFSLADKRLYVKTYRKENGKTEFYIFDTKGKLLKRTYLSIFERNLRSPYPFWFYGGKHYQLNDNGDTEKWELHITDVLL